jgi:threo-3-hydroxy-L-aspartate ammonia-lyase
VIADVGIDDIERAAERIDGRVHRTPIVTSHQLDDFAGRSVFVKAEALQRAGSHKTRGAVNWFAAALERGESLAGGVVTASSGNHAQGVALAGRDVGVPVTVVVPATTNPLKVAATIAYGAEVYQDGVDWSNRDEVADRLVAERGGRRNHADDPESIAGFGTIGLEVLEQVPDVDTIVVPVSTGAVMSGIATAVRARQPEVAIIGVEPAISADAKASLAAGRIERLAEPAMTIADGARALSLTSRTFPVLSRLVDDIVTVTEEEILDAVWWLWTRTKTLVEPTGAMPLAAARNLGHERRRVVCVATGGNADIVDLAARFAAAGLPLR